MPSDGRPPTRRWWPVCIAAVGVVVIDVVWFALTPLHPEIEAIVAARDAGIGQPRL